MSSYFFLLIIALLGYLGNNKLLVYAALTLCIIKMLPFSEPLLAQLKSKGLNIGVYTITVAILVPIAIGSVGFNELKVTITDFRGIIALGIGVIASIIATKGIYLQQITPEIVVFISLGTIIGITLFGGTAVGPIVAGGIAYFVYAILERIIK